jgi:hypothetical protein
MAFHYSIKHSPHSSRVVPCSHEHNGSQLMLVAPSRKHPTFTFGSTFSSGDLYDIRHPKPPQLANLPCARILVREPPADELVVFSTRRVGKNRNARRDATPAPPESSDTILMSAGASGSLTTSAHPAARRTGSRTEGIATMATAANAKGRISAARSSSFGFHLQISPGHPAHSKKIVAPDTSRWEV